MTTITVSMKWEIEEGFHYNITASEEVATAKIAETQEYLHDLCREHRQVVQAAVDAYNQRESHQATARGQIAWAARELAYVEKNKDNPRYSIQNDVAKRSAAARQIAASEAQAKADAVTVDETWLPW